MTAPTSTLRSHIRDRRSIRRFLHRPVPRDLVAGLLREAIWSPSPHNSQPWRFTVLFGRTDRACLADAMAAQLAEELAADGLDAVAIERQTSRSRTRITEAPVAILVSLAPDGLVLVGDERRDALEWQMAVQSVGTVLQSLFLLAAEEGIGTCWMAAPMYCPEVVRATLGLPEEHVPQALVLLGYPDGPGRIRERRAFANIVDLR